MKFTKFGKALCLGALSVGAICGVTSCIESYATGYLYVTGTVTASSGNNGIISGYEIDHNTGQLLGIHGLPVASGGANPVRAVLTTSSTFLYVLNRGVNSSGTGDCYTANPCQNANITQFVVGGNGILTPEETFYTQGINPFRLLTDASGGYLLVLDHDAPDSNAYTHLGAANNSCTEALGSGTTSCGDITVFQINQSTGRLSLVVNAQVTSASGSALTYFPVPANPVDFTLFGSGALLTLTAPNAAAPTSYPYTGATSVWPYAYFASTGQLTLSQNSVQQLTAGTTSGGSAPMQQGTTIVSAANVIYVLDNEPISTTFNGSTATSASQILPFTLGAGNALSAEPSGIIPDDSTLANPSYLMVDSRNQYVYVANQGNNVTGNNPESGIAAYFLTTQPTYEWSFISGEPFGSGSGPQCIVEDPSGQYIFEANEYDSTVTGRILDPNSGELDGMRVSSTYSLEGPPTWCLMDGRTN